MQTMFAEWSAQPDTIFVEGRFEIGEDDSPDSEGISARGLEILRVLNDLFNTLPGEAERSQD